jgi:PAS domain S-box-containing protein
MALNLSERESQILQSQVSGYTERETCNRLGIEPGELARIWERVREEVETGEMETLADAEIKDGYHRVERRRLEAELWASEARLAALMDTAPEAILVVDGRNGTILRVNNQSLILFGYTMREMIGASMEMLVPNELKDIHVSYRVGFLNSVRKREMGYHPLIQALCKDGSLVELDIALTATSATDDVMVVCRAASKTAELPVNRQVEA